MDINNRIKEIRKKHKLTLSKFGEKIGLSESTLSRIERGEYPVTERTIKLICSEFDINEEWLRTGEGDTHIVMKPHEELGKQLGLLFREKGELSEYKQRIITHMLKLPDDQWPILARLINAFIDEEIEKQKKNGDT